MLEPQSAKRKCRVTESSPHPASRLQRLWLCEAIRLREEHSGPLGQRGQPPGAPGRRPPGRAHQKRALFLATRDSQAVPCTGCRARVWHCWRCSCWPDRRRRPGLCRPGRRRHHQPVLGPGQPARPAPADLLGWALGMLAAGEHRGRPRPPGLGSAASARPAAQRSWGRRWFCCSAAPAPQPLAARRLVHGLWLLALLAALVMLLVLLSTRRYGFVWETTLLPADTFVALTHLLGALPALLGFPCRTSTIRPAVPPRWPTRLPPRLGRLAARRTAGVRPAAARPVPAAVPGRWQRGRARLALNLNDPAYRLLAERLQPPSEHLGGHRCRPAALPQSHAGSQLQASSGAPCWWPSSWMARAWPPKLPARWPTPACWTAASSASSSRPPALPAGAPGGGRRPAAHRTVAPGLLGELSRAPGATRSPAAARPRATAGQPAPGRGQRPCSAWPALRR